MVPRNSFAFYQQETPMQTLRKVSSSILVVMLVMIIASGCGQPFSRAPSTTNTPIDSITLPGTPISQTSAIAMTDASDFATSTVIAALTTATPGLSQTLPTPFLIPSTGDAVWMATGTALVQQSVENEIFSGLRGVDERLSQSMQSIIAYSAPQAMRLSDTVTVLLDINPPKTPEQLSNESIQNQPGMTPPELQVITPSVEITDRIYAELIPDDKDAFTILPIPSHPEQLLSSEESTRWEWRLTAHKPGPQRLTLVIYRLVRYTGLEYWRPVQTYKAAIRVEVTLSQRLAALDWKWIVGIVVTALLIIASWRVINSRRKRAETAASQKLQ
jgi:hypothetical protein